MGRLSSASYYYYYYCNITLQYKRVDREKEPAYAIGELEERISLFGFSLSTERRDLGGATRSDSVSELLRHRT